ncbi:MAG TPA: hypothetical protein V6C81_02745 [Planktothrix sp.]|jgi:hypothetical protein
MNRFKKSVGMGFIFTLYIMCFYFFFAVMQALFEGTNMVAAAMQSLGVGAFLWFVFSFGIYELLGFVEQRNKEQDEERKRQEEEYRKRQGLPPLEKPPVDDDKPRS